MARRSKTPAALPPAPPLTLPAELTIYTAGELHPQWLAWLGERPAAPADGAPPARVLAAAVDQVDGAGLQLLLALQRSLNERGHRLAIDDPSDVLCQGCESLGLGDWLRSHAAAPDGATA
ncbi:MAG: STAS domain-containing protein [Rubrivivax sp.]|nr:STAS domain-containing protein [Rubrivivax sp.]